MAAFINLNLYEYRFPALIFYGYGNKIHEK